MGKKLRPHSKLSMFEEQVEHLEPVYSYITIHKFNKAHWVVSDGVNRVDFWPHSGKFVGKHPCTMKGVAKDFLHLIRKFAQYALNQRGKLVQSR